MAQPMLEVAKQLLKLAKAGEKNCQVISKDSDTLGSLVLALADANTECCETAAEAVFTISRVASTRPSLLGQFGLLPALEAFETDDRATAVTRQYASKALANIRQQSLSSPEPSRRKPLAEAQQTPAHSFFKGKVNKMAKTILLQIEGLDDLSQRDILEQQLLRVKGVVSFTFNMKTSRVTVRVRDWLQIEKLCDAVAKTGTMTAQQVVRNESGEEVMLSFGQSPTKFNEPKSLPSVPGYLDEIEEHDAAADAHAIGRIGGEKQGDSWISSIGGYLAKTLYW